jgi:hypothetical protein
MTKVTIVADDSNSSRTTFRAMAREKESIGPTPGAALDALTEQLGDDAGTLVVVQRFQPDVFFSAGQQRRLEELMTKWRAARDAKTHLAPDEQTELEALVDAELDGATQRTAAIVRELGT